MTQLIIPTTESVGGSKEISSDIQEVVQTAAVCSNTPTSVVGHPLQTAWTFWYDKKIRLSNNTGSVGRKESDITTLMDSAHYANNLNEIHTFNTVEEFYRAFAFIKKASDLPIDFNISLFREGFKPMWEEFPKGGMWIVRIRRGQTIDVKSGRTKKKRNSSINGNSLVRVPLVDVMWENLVLALVGELFAMPEVVGAILSVRCKENVLSAWNTDNENPAVRFRVGRKLRDIYALSPNTLMRYKDFEQAMKDCSSYRNAQKFLFTTDEGDIKTPQGRKNFNCPLMTVTPWPITNKPISSVPPSIETPHCDINEELRC